MDILSLLPHVRDRSPNLIRAKKEEEEEDGGGSTKKIYYGGRAVLFHVCKSRE